MDEKEVEEIIRKQNQLAGELSYYQSLAGKYRNENHSNLIKVKRYKKLCFIFAGLFIVSAAAAVIIGIIR